VKTRPGLAQTIRLPPLAVVQSRHAEALRRRGFELADAAEDDEPAQKLLLRAIDTHKRVLAADDATTDRESDSLHADALQERLPQTTGADGKNHLAAATAAVRTAARR
jgi:hypothetical protein